MPIHVRAEPGDYAEAVLLPGDPLRAKYIAETYLDEVVQRNERARPARLHGHLRGRAGLGAGHRHGLPGATIVFEELIQLGCKKLIRVGTCGGLQPNHALGDLIVALTAVPADATAMHLVGNEPHCPTADWELVHGAVHAAKEPARSSTSGRSSRATSSTTPTRGSTSAGRSAACSPSRWRRRRSSRVGALRGVAGRLPADRQRHRRRGRVHAHHRRRASRRRRPDDARRARDVTASERH